MKMTTIGALAVAALLLGLGSMGLTASAATYELDVAGELALLNSGSIVWAGGGCQTQCVSQAGFCTHFGAGACCLRNANGSCACVCKFCGGQLGCYPCGSPGICPA